MYFIKPDRCELKLNNHLSIKQIGNEYRNYAHRDGDPTIFDAYDVVSGLNINSRYIKCLIVSTSHGIILSDAYNIYNTKTLLKFNIDVKQHIDYRYRSYTVPNYIQMCSWHGYINVLEWLKNSKFVLELQRNGQMVAFYASMNNQIDVLEWWKNSELKCLVISNVTLNPMTYFQRWKNSVLEYSHIVKTLNIASENGHVNVLEWWKNSGLKFEYSKDVLDLAFKNGHINVLTWWNNSGLPIK
jgi:hypothetical protein